MRKKLGLSFLLSLGIVATTSLGFSSWIIPALTFVASPSGDDSVRAVAYVGGHSDIKYATIESAIEATSQYGDSQQTVYVIPGISSIDNPILIDDDLTIPSGVTLCLPYSGEQATDVRNATGSYFADRNRSSVSNNLKTCVKLDGTLTIENGGSLVIGGQIGSGSANKPQGMTTGMYAQLTMSENSSIYCEGSIVCQGYIKPENPAADDSTEIVVGTQSGISAALTMPLVFYDYGGGAAAVSMYTNANLASFLRGDSDPYVFPLRVFDFPNIAVPTSVYGGSKVTALFGFNFYTLSQLGMEPQLMGDVALVGVGSEAFFNLQVGSHVVFDYDPVYGNNYSSGNAVDLCGYTTDDFSALIASPPASGSSANRTRIEIFGSATISDINATIPMSVTIPGLVSDSITITTAGIFIPFSYKLDISIFSGTLEVPTKTKWYPGSELTISKGATVSFSGDTIFYEADTFPNGLTGWSRYPEPTTDSFSDALLINHGTVLINSSFGGNISNGGEGDSESVQFQAGSSRSVALIECTGSPDCGYTILGVTVGGENVCETVTYSMDAKGTIYSSNTSTDYVAGALFSNYSQSSFVGDGTAYRPVDQSILTLVEEPFVDQSGNTLSYDLFVDGTPLETVEGSSGQTRSYAMEKSSTVADVKLENTVNVAYVLYGGNYYLPDDNGTITVSWNKESSARLSIVPRSGISPVIQVSMNATGLWSNADTKFDVVLYSNSSGNRSYKAGSVTWETSFSLSQGIHVNKSSTFQTAGCDWLRVGDFISFENLSRAELASVDPNVVSINGRYMLTSNCTGTLSFTFTR